MMMRTLVQVGSVTQAKSAYTLHQNHFHKDKRQVTIVGDKYLFMEFPQIRKKKAWLNTISIAYRMHRKQ